MKIEAMEKLVDEILLPACKKIRLSKGLAYSGTEDKLGNFKRCASATGVSPEIALFIYMMKHIDAISSYTRGEYVDSESIKGRIQDVINYCFLLYALICEKEAN